MGRLYTSRQGLTSILEDYGTVREVQLLRTLIFRSVVQSAVCLQQVLWSL